MHNRHHPAKPALHACVGVMCPVHQRCARYSFVDGTREPSTCWLGTCSQVDNPGQPGFIDVAFVGPPGPAHYRLTRGAPAALPGRCLAPS